MIKSRAAWLLPASLALAAAAGCTGTLTDDGLDPNDHLPPTVEVMTPERGTVTADGSVVVSGRATDAESSIATVTVNGVPADLADDGSFQATLSGGEGITLIETIATDRGGNTASDARAMLTGNLVPNGAPISDAIAAFVSSQAMSGLGDLVGGYTSGIDLTALAKSFNPVAASGGESCNNYKAYVDSVERGPIDVAVNAADGGMQGTVTIRDLVVHGHVDWRGLCQSGSSNYTITADAYDAGALIEPHLDAGGISITLSSVTSGFRGFSLDVSGLPGFVEDQFEGAVRDKIASILRDKISEVVPPQADAFLAGFLAKAISLELLGQTVDMSVWPSAMSWTAAGGSIVLDTQTSVVGVSDYLVLSSPQPRPSDADMASTGLRIAVADDMLNHILAGMWASGAMEDALLPADGDALSAVFGGDVASATLTMMLPPVASFDTTTGTAQLTVGDVMVEAIGQDGSSLASFVVSANVDLAVETRSDGSVKIITRAPHILAQVLSQSDSLLVALDSAKVAAIAELAIKQLATSADELLGNLPVPGLPGATITSPTFQPLSGYLMMGGDLQYQ